MKSADCSTAIVFLNRYKMRESSEFENDKVTEGDESDAYDNLNFM